MKEAEMDEMAKLKHLLEHWIEHNEDHEKTYAEWANKALAAGKPELAEALKELAHETRKMEKLILKAMKSF
jgi:rubrerythrin